MINLITYSIAPSIIFVLLSKFQLSSSSDARGEVIETPTPPPRYAPTSRSNVMNFAQSDLVRTARWPPFLVTCSGPVDQWQQNRVVARRRIRRTCCSWQWRHRFEFQNFQAITIIYGYTQLWRMKHKMACSYNKLLIQSKHTKTRVKTSTCYSFFLKRDELWRHSKVWCFCLCGSSQPPGSRHIHRQNRSLMSWNRRDSNINEQHKML